jgi:hypothetical protein
MDRALSQPLNIDFRGNLSENVSTLIEVLKALNIGTIIPSAFTLALLWKLYGVFNQLSEKLTRIETKVDSLKELVPYKIREIVDQEIKNKAKKHNPRIETSDFVEIVGVSFGIMDILVFIAVLYQNSSLASPLTYWILFFLPGLFGVLPIIVSERTISKDVRAVLSLVSLAPWVYLMLIVYGVIPPLI